MDRAWVSQQLYCPNSRQPSRSHQLPAEGFLCRTSSPEIGSDQFDLREPEKVFGAKGRRLRLSHEIERLVSSTKPEPAAAQLSILRGPPVAKRERRPKNFFVPGSSSKTQAAGQIPLGEPAGSDQNILAGKVPQSGANPNRAPAGYARTQGTKLLEAWANRTLFSRDRAWGPRLAIEVMNLRVEMGPEDSPWKKFYAFETILDDYPNNRT